MAINESTLTKGQVTERIEICVSTLLGFSASAKKRPRDR